MAVKAVVLDVSFTDDEGVQGFVDVSYTNACSFNAEKTVRAARTAGKAASERAMRSGTGTPRRTTRTRS